MKEGDVVLFWSIFGVAVLVFFIGFICGKWWEQEK